MPAGTLLRSAKAESSPPDCIVRIRMKLERTTQCLEATKADLSGSSFTDVNLANASFNDVNLTNASFNDVNLSGAVIHNVNLSNLRISQVNLRGVSIVESHTEGMTINGIPVTDLLAAYRRGAAS